jgi:hypothetical protein
MLWEEGADPLDCACTVKPYFKARLRTHFHERLGGDWSMTQGEHPLTRWLHDAAQLRHRVVHRGYRPSAAECQRSLDSLDAVHEFVSQRLIEHLQTYFRTCVAVIGTPGLADRGLLSDEIDARLAAEGYDWVDSYRDWADAFYSARYARE